MSITRDDNVLEQMKQNPWSYQARLQEKSEGRRLAEEMMFEWVEDTIRKIVIRLRCRIVSQRKTAWNCAGFLTPYWAVKLRSNRDCIKYFKVTFHKSCTLDIDHLLIWWLLLGVVLS